MKFTKLSGNGSTKTLILGKYTIVLPQRHGEQEKKHRAYTL